MIYDNLPRIDLGTAPELFWRSIHESMEIDSILDVGSGHSGVHDCGYWTAKSMSRKASCDIFTCRPSPSCWEIHEGVDACSLALAFGEKSFDLVQCMECLEHIEQSRLALEQLCEVAKKLVMVSSCDEYWHAGPGQEYYESINKHQKYVGQPLVSDLLALGFEVAVDSHSLRQLLAWKVI